MFVYGAYASESLRGGAKRQKQESKARMRWSETLGYQMLDEHGKPTSPVINYIGRPEPDVAPEAMGGEGHESD
jgi:hypothetical protein